MFSQVHCLLLSLDYLTLYEGLGLGLGLETKVLVLVLKKSLIYISDPGRGGVSVNDVCKCMCDCRVGWAE